MYIFTTNERYIAKMYPYFQFFLLLLMYSFINLFIEKSVDKFLYYQVLLPVQKKAQPSEIVQMSIIVQINLI